MQLVLCGQEAKRICPQPLSQPPDSVTALQSCLGPFIEEPFKPQFNLICGCWSLHLPQDHFWELHSSGFDGFPESWKTIENRHGFLCIIN